MSYQGFKCTSRNGVSIITVCCCFFFKLLRFFSIEVGVAAYIRSELDALIDFFYYAQLRTQGEGTTLPRDVKGSVPLSEVRQWSVAVC